LGCLAELDAYVCCKDGVADVCDAGAVDEACGAESSV